MKITNTYSLILFTVIACGCGSETAPPENVITGVAKPAISAWEQAETLRAVSIFVETDWSKRPLFDSTSALSLSEDQFMSKPPSDRGNIGAELYWQTSLLRELVSAVEQSGLDELSKGNMEQARKYFTSLKQFGEAMNSSEHSKLVQQFGRKFSSDADSKLKEMRE